MTDDQVEPVAAKPEHVAVLDFTDGYARASLRCHAAPDAMCHAEYDCDCERWFSEGVEDGLPWHDAGDYSESKKVRHVGRFVDRCGLSDWAENSEEWLYGEVTVPVRAEWQGDFYTFHFTPAASATAGAERREFSVAFEDSGTTILAVYDTYDDALAERDHMGDGYVIERTVGEWTRTGGLPAAEDTQ